MFYIGTSQGVFLWDEDGHARSALGPEEDVRQVVASGDGKRVAAVGEGSVIWERKGRGDWRRLPLPAGEVEATSLLLAPDGETLYVGSEPCALYRKRWGDAEWELLCALHRLPLAEGWHTPWGGPAAVRTMAAKWVGEPMGQRVNGSTQQRGKDDVDASTYGSIDQLYLDIHVGGIALTRDGGKSWTSINDGLEEDVHEVITHPRAPSRVYAATADGFYLSEDEGATWHRRSRGLDNLYCRGVAAHPAQPDVILISGSPFAPPGWRRHGAQFALFRSENAGRSWRRVKGGLPDPSPGVIDTNSIAFSRRQPDYALCAIGSALYASEDAGATWQQVTDELPEIQSVYAGQDKG